MGFNDLTPDDQAAILNCTLKQLPAEIHKRTQGGIHSIRLTRRERRYYNQVIAGKPMPLCVFCRSAPARERDHVPPDNIFASGGSQLITVPACATCNRANSKNDVYFRDSLALREQVQGHPLAKEMVEASQRGMRHSNATAYRTTMMKQLDVRLVNTPLGILVPKVFITVDGDRLERIVARIVAGLFYHERGTPLPLDYDARAFEATKGEIYTSRLQDLYLPGPPKIVSQGEFAYKWSSPPEDPNTTMWLMRFYDTVAYVGSTFPRSMKSDQPPGFPNLE